MSRHREAHPVTSRDTLGGAARALRVSHSRQFHSSSFRRTRKSGWGWLPIGASVTPRLDFYGGLTRSTCSSWSSSYRWSSWHFATRAFAGRSGALWSAGIIWRRDTRKSEISLFIPPWISELKVRCIPSALSRDLALFFRENLIEGRFLKPKIRIT